MVNKIHSETLSPSRPLTGSPRGRLLIVDDEPEFLAPLCEFLARSGYEVKGVTSGSDALAELKTRAFDVLLTDLVMPEMNGIELLKAALKAEPDLVAIVITGHGTIPGAVEAMKRGAFDYMVKPLEFRTLEPLLSRALTVRRLRMENVQLREKLDVYMLRAALQETENFYRTVFENTGTAMAIIEEDATISLVNAEFEKLSGYSKDEIEGKKKWTEFVLKADLEGTQQYYRMAFAGATPHPRHFEFRFLDRNGSVKDISLTAAVIPGTQRGMGALMDITDRKKMEEEILLTKHDWEDTFNTITDMITVHDKDFNIMRANKAAEKILGLPVWEKIADGKCFRYYHGTEKPPEGCPSCSCFRTGQPATFELFEPNLNMFIEIRAIPRLDSNDNVVGLIHVVRDITERKKTQEWIQDHIQRLSSLRFIGLAITSSLDLRVTLKVFIDHVVTQLGVDAADVLLLKPHARILEYAAGQGFRTGALKHSHLRLGEGYAGVAALENRIVSIPDLKEEGGGLKRSKLLEGEDFMTYFGVPLVAKGHVTGVLEIFHRSPLEPDEEWFEYLDALALQAAIAIDSSSLFCDLERSNTELSLAYDSTIEGWSRALDYRDKETEGHSQRVTEMTLKIAREMGMNEEELVNVRRGALLHDIGKMAVPDSILLKPGPLTEEEWKIMRQHPVYSYDLLFPIAYLRPALDIPYCHHEKWDGTGYPRGLKGEQIPLCARIFAVVDVWDALCSDRPYRLAWSEEKAKEHIRSLSGIHFDPAVVDIFVRAVAEFWVSHNR